MNSPVRRTIPGPMTQATVTTTGTTTTYSASTFTSTLGGAYTIQVPLTESIPASHRVRIKQPLGKVDIESAVYAHIQAMRALGITRTDTSEIARALGLDTAAVEKSIPALTQKGVKVING
jgi:hypothetical protein